MEVIHNLGILSTRKNINENAGFLLTNKKGGYCSFYNNPTSRYHGLFYFDEKTMSMYKFIENIEVVGNNEVSSLKNGLYFAERRKHDAAESFFMPKNFNSLIYELSGGNEIDLILDCKDSFDNREWGRYYEIYDEQGCVLVKFTKKTDRREDSIDGAPEFELYLAIKSDENSYQKNCRWAERHYTYDEERKSRPFKRHVYNALRMKGRKFVFSMSKNKNEAVSECKCVFGSANEIKAKEKGNFFSLLKNEQAKRIIKNESLSNDIKVAYINAVNSLNNLIVYKNKKSIVSEFAKNEAHSHSAGILAGLPWFFQFWARDTLISLKALLKIDREFSRKMLFYYLNIIGDDGRLANLAGNHGSIKLGNADAHGWLFLRCNGLIEKINRNKETINSIKKSINIIKSIDSKSQKIKDYVRKCASAVNKKENEYHQITYEIESSLEKSLNGLLKFHTEGGFEISNKLETWIDTEFEKDIRDGVRIEIQALRLNMYKLMFELTQNQKYKALENLLRAKVREKFWNGKMLADGLNDFTVRPNIFIAAYAYPELLSQKEWDMCFDNALKNLWLDWGGLSTIDKNHPLFADVDTGEDIKSYHRGNSWFWINNLAAITLNRINKKKFKKQIQKIIEASTEEILWKGCIGCHSELSSARRLESNGCFNQAWSNAMFIEMIDEIFK